MKDLTKGNILKLMLVFSLPILLGSIFQQAYNLADIIIVGKKLGTNALSAVAATAPVVGLLFSFINGLSTGFSIPVAKYFGSAEQEKMKNCIGGMITFSAIATVVLMFACLVFIDPFLMAINTPPNIFDQARSYLIIVVAGLAVTLIYNLEASILRAVGDSVIPLVILVISAVLNILLDLLFVYVFSMGVEGAAVATVIAQLLSAVVCFLYIIKKYPFLRISGKDFIPGRISVPALLSAGFSMALMYSIVDIGSIVLQNGINGFGGEIISAHISARKIFGLTITPFSAISATLVTLVSQNFGAGKFDRIKSGIKYALLLGIGWSTIAVIIIYLFSEPIVRLVAPENTGDIIDTAVNYLKINVPFYYFLTVLLSLRCTLQGLGKAIVPIGASIFEMLWKIATVVFAIPALGYMGVCISEPITWVVGAVLVSIITLKSLKNVF